MVSKFGTDITWESAYNPIELWLRKVLRRKSGELLSNCNVDKWDFYRLVTNNRNPLDLFLIMQNEKVFCTSIGIWVQSVLVAKSKVLIWLMADNASPPCLPCPWNNPSASTRKFIFLSSKRRWQGWSFKYSFLLRYIRKQSRSYSHVHSDKTVWSPGTSESRKFETI